MAENAGGLDYRINVGGDWKAELSAFEARINKLKSDAAKLSSGTKAPKKEATVSRTPEIKAEQDISDITKKRIALQRQARVLQDDGVKSDLQGLKIARQSAQYSDVQTNARLRNAKASSELAIKEAQINQLMRDQGITARRAAEQVGLTSAQAKQLKLNMWDAEHAARQFLFTFRRLVGILAVFTLARKFAQAIGAGVREMVRINAEVETTRNSIATLISSVGRIYDAQGNLLTGQDAFNAAILESDKIVLQLQKDAIGSVATFESLTKAFQVAVGPGLSAGLDVEQIREVTKRLVEGAVAMKVPLDQMSEEIRSILQGTATSKNTRLVSLFGGSAAQVNQQIKQARESGKLYGFLMEKLKGVQAGATAAASSMNVLKSDLQDTLSILAKEGGISLFNALKEAIFGLRNALAVSTKEQGFVFSPDALAVVREVSDTLAGMVNSFRRITDTQQDLNLLRNILASLADTVSIIAPLAISVFQGILTGVNAVIAPVRFLADGLREVAKQFGFVGEAADSVVKYMVAGATAMILWANAAKTLAAIFGVRGLLGSIKNIGLKLVGIELTAQGVAATMARTVVATQGWGIALSLASRGLLKTLGPIGLIVSVLGVILTATGAWSKAMAYLNPPIKDANKEMKEFQGRIYGAANSLENLRPEFKDIASTIKKLKEDLASVATLAGIEEQSKKILELYVQRSEIIKDVTKTENDAIAQAKQQMAEKLALIDEEQKSYKVAAVLASDAAFKQAEAIKTQDKQTKSWLSRLASAVPLLNRFRKQVSSPTVNVFGEIDPQKAAMEAASNVFSQAAAKREAIVQQYTSQISVAEQSILDKVAQINEEYDLRVAKTMAENEALKLSRQLEIDKAEAAGNYAASLVRGTDSAMAEAILARTKLEIIKEQTKAIQDQQDKTELLIASFRSAAQQKILDTSTVEQDIKDVERVLSGTLTEEGRKAATARLAGLQQLQEIRVSAQKDIVALDQQLLDAQQAFENKKVQQAADFLNARREADRASLKASNSFVDGIELGLRDFVTETPKIGEAIGDSIKSSLDGVAGAFGTAFREYIATGENVSAVFYQALGDVFLNLAEEFATTVAKQLISKIAGGVLDFGFNAASNAPLIASNAALVASINANTAAMGGALPASLAANTAATTGDATATTANTGGLLANTGSLLTNTASLIGTAVAWTANTIATIANSAALAASSLASALGSILGGLSNVLVVAAIGAQTAIQSALLLSIAGLLLTANGLLASIAIATWGDWATPFPFKKGGMVPKGYAHGGEIGGFARPASIPASDTVPAWLTPGEYVLPVGIVDKLGVGFLDALRSGVVSPSSFRSAASSLTASSSAIRGFASGGPVVSNSNAVSAGNRPVNVAFFDDRKAMRRWAESSEGETAIMKVMQKNSFKFA